MDDELIRWCALATRAACARMTPPQLKALQDSIGQLRAVPARSAWDRKATAHAQVFNLLADVITDRAAPGLLADVITDRAAPGLLADVSPVPGLLRTQAVGAVHDLMLTVGPAADGIILSSRRRLLDLIRAGDADGAAAEMEQHLRRLRFLWQLSRSSEPQDVAV